MAIGSDDASTLIRQNNCTDLILSEHQYCYARLQRHSLSVVF